MPEANESLEKYRPVGDGRHLRDVLDTWDADKPAVGDYRGILLGIDSTTLGAYLDDDVLKRIDDSGVPLGVILDYIINDVYGRIMLSDDGWNDILDRVMDDFKYNLEYAPSVIDERLDK